MKSHQKLIKYKTYLYTIQYLYKKFFFGNSSRQNNVKYEMYLIYYLIKVYKVFHQYVDVFSLV